MTSLALLVGTNPLPNVVTALALHRNSAVALSQVRLYFTTGRPDVPFDRATHDIATRTRTVLETPDLLGNMTVTSVPLPSPVDVQAIKDTIVADLKRNAGDRLHVNYTGGTKAMARGAWLAAEQLARSGPQVAASYLDDRPERHALRQCILDSQGRIDGWTHTGDLRRGVTLTLSNLLYLHKMKMIAPSAAPPVRQSPTVRASSRAPAWPRTGCSRPRRAQCRFSPKAATGSRASISWRSRDTSCCSARSPPAALSMRVRTRASSSNAPLTR